MSADHLVKMANQIGVSVPDQSAAAAQTAAHLRSFWTPSMIEELARHCVDHPEAASSTVRSALDLLHPEVSSR